MSTELIKIALIDDHNLIRDSFRAVFCEENGFNLVSESEKASLAINICRKFQPDVLLMDIRTKDGDSGLDALSGLRSEFPLLKIILMSGFDELSYIPRAKALGADAFIFKSKGMDFFVETIRSVLNGETHFPAPRGIPVSAGERPLTEREMDVLRRLCKNETRAAIAKELCITENTVNKHIENMRAKTGFASLFELVVHVMSNGWINPKY